MVVIYCWYYLKLIDSKFKLTYCNLNFTGDLTDAKTIDRMGSQQFLEEWQHYKKILDDSKVAEKTTWLDVRGNHGMSAQDPFLTQLINSHSFCAAKMKKQNFRVFFQLLFTHVSLKLPRYIILRKKIFLIK